MDIIDLSIAQLRSYVDQADIGANEEKENLLFIQEVCLFNHFDTFIYLIVSGDSIDAC